MDVDRAAELYAAGWTLRRIGAELGVDHSTVAYRLHRAGVILRRGGPRRHDVDTHHILDLRDRGMSMAAIAAQVGMSLKGVGPGTTGRARRTGPTVQRGSRRAKWFRGREC